MCWAYVQKSRNFVVVLWEILGFLVATELQRFLGFCDGRSGEKDDIFHFLGLSFEPKPSISKSPFLNFF
ncbi:hypothetical protein AAC387_Pa11g0171 [Persea americana]